MKFISFATKHGKVVLIAPEAVTQIVEVKDDITRIVTGASYVEVNHALGYVVSALGEL